MIEFKNLTFQYPQSKHPLFNGINLKIPAGSLSLVAGPSGSGKSTLLRCINGLVPHFSGGKISGSVSVFDWNPIEESPEKMAEIVGFVFQEPEAQFVYDTVEDEIAFVLENFRIPYAEMHQRVDEITQSFELKRFRKAKLKSLSGGEKQKVALASVMINRPKILLLDEPTSQLDPASAEEILEFVLKITAQYGLTVLISEHRLERLLPYIDNIIYINQAHKVQFGHPQLILPKMSQVPPIIKIGRKYNLSPLPLSVDEFSKVKSSGQKSGNPLQNDYSTERPSLVEIQNFSVTLSGQQILREVNLNINAGEILTILGPNGAGKTTLLRAIMGLVKSEGKKHLHQEDMSAMKLSDLIDSIAYLPQNPNDLLFSTTVLDELQTTLRNHGLKQHESELTSHLNQFKLAPLKDQFPRDLSVGERQRTALAAITVHDPRIIFLDEPTRGMDYRAKASLASMAQGWRDQGKAVVLVTHDVEFAATLSDRVVLLEAGQIRFDGNPKTAFTSFPGYRTQTANLFPGSGWITPEDLPQ
jgi:energy-coupling factor transport system ATP-binding protein